MPRSAMLALLGLIGCIAPDAAPSDGGVTPADAGSPRDAAARRDAGRDAAWPDASIGVPAEDAGPPLEVDDAGRGDVGPSRVETLVTTLTAASAPPPLSGGTLALSPDDAYVVVSDPDRDRIVVVEVATHAVAVVLLAPGDEPGRAVVDASGRAHVALRRGGAVVSVELATARLVGRRPVCPTPRGIAFDPATDRLHVACASGELVTLPTEQAPAVRTLQVDSDLRDVVVQGALLFVSRFRAAEILVLATETGALLRRVPLPDDGSGNTAAAVAWRMIASPRGGVSVAYQLVRSTAAPVMTSSPGGYGSGGCRGSIVHTALSELAATDGARPTGPLLLSGCATLPVDLASNGLEQLFVVAAGATPLAAASQIMEATRDTTTLQLSIAGPLPRAIDPGGRLIAIAASAGGLGVSQTREPASLWIQQRGEATPTQILLGGDSVADVGFELFHSNAGGGIACASCHPEGGDDGRVWSFEGFGARRTIALRGGLLGTEPFHWSGDLADFGALSHEVFAFRMSGGELTPEHVDALARWIDRNPTLPPQVVAAPDAVERGRVLFESDALRCVDCHTGPRLSNEATLDVGTGGEFQVPSLLGLSYRAPYLHDGCARTLRERFEPACGGGEQHGHTAHLTPEELDDLVAYLGTL